MERVWGIYILPLSTSGSKTGEVDELLWTDKLLNVMRHLSDKSIEILISLSTVKERCGFWYTQVGVADVPELVDRECAISI